MQDLFSCDVRCLVSVEQSSYYVRGMCCNNTGLGLSYYRFYFKVLQSLKQKANFFNIIQVWTRSWSVVVNYLGIHQHLSFSIIPSTVQVSNSDKHAFTDRRILTRGRNSHNRNLPLATISAELKNGWSLTTHTRLHVFIPWYLMITLELQTPTQIYKFMN